MDPTTQDEIRAVQKYRSSIPLTRDEIMTIQRLRNASLLSEQSSPVPPEERQNFRGLDFFPIDEKYQLRLKLRRYENPEPVQISLSNGERVGALRAGCFNFELEGKSLRLYVYKKRPSDTELFLPFRDKTSGKETYGAGRYLDLFGTSEDNFVLDFNLAYNPLCAFAEKNSDCPLPPPENWLMDLEVRAGEMKFKK